jgi:hypothetical protein
MRIGGETSFVVGQAPLEQSSVVLVSELKVRALNESPKDRQQLTRMRIVKLRDVAATKRAHRPKAVRSRVGGQVLADPERLHKQL